MYVTFIIYRLLSSIIITYDIKRIKTYYLHSNYICYSLGNLDTQREKIIERILPLICDRSPPQDRKEIFTLNWIPFIQHDQRWLHPDEISCPTGEQILQITDNNQLTRDGDSEAIRIKPSVLISIDFLNRDRCDQPC